MVLPANTSEGTLTRRGPSRTGGRLLTDLSNALVALHRKHYGRGPGAAKSFIADDLVVCVLSDVYTTVERTLVEAGKTDHVREARQLHQPPSPISTRRRSRTRPAAR